MADVNKDKEPEIVDGVDISWVEDNYNIDDMKLDSELKELTKDMSKEEIDEAKRKARKRTIAKRVKSRRYKRY